jgi:integrase
MGSNTAMKYVSTLKQVVNKAIGLGWILYNPLSGFKCPYVQPEREILTMAEILNMHQKKMPLIRLEEAKDIYIFCCFTGLAYNEVYSLTSQNIQVGNGGKKWIVIDRQKTGSPEHVPLLNIAGQIIEKYKKHQHCLLNNRLLPVNCNQNYNGSIKEIAVICGIDKDLSSHTARHTFATTVTLENDVPLESVSKMLGHKSMKTTQIYARITKRN